MILTVLGSAAAGANPGSGCTGYLLTSGPTAVLIDCGPGTVGELKRWIDVRRLDGIVISHMHLDHFLDLVTLRAAFRYAPVPFEGRVPLWLPPGGSRVLDDLAAPLDLSHQSPLFFDQVFETHEYNPIDSLQIGELSLDFAPTQHEVATWATRIARSGSERAIGITSDTGPLTNLAAFLRDVEALFCEATLIETEDSPVERGHLTAGEAGRLAHVSEAKRLILTHFWSEIDASLLLAAAMSTYERQVELAWPGMQVTVS